MSFKTLTVLLSHSFPIDVDGGTEGQETENLEQIYLAKAERQAVYALIRRPGGQRSGGRSLS